MKSVRNNCHHQRERERETDPMYIKNFQIIVAACRRQEKIEKFSNDSNNLFAHLKYYYLNQIYICFFVGKHSLAGFSSDCIANFY